MKITDTVLIVKIEQTYLDYVMRELESSIKRWEKCREYFRENLLRLDPLLVLANSENNYFEEAAHYEIAKRWEAFITSSPKTFDEKLTIIIDDAEDDIMRWSGSAMSRSTSRTTNIANDARAQATLRLLDRLKSIASSFRSSLDAAQELLCSDTTKEHVLAAFDEVIKTATNKQTRKRLETQRYTIANVVWDEHMKENWITRFGRGTYLRHVVRQMHDEAYRPKAQPVTA